MPRRKRRRSKKPLPPRRLRLNRTRRLQVGAAFVAGYGGRKILRSYANWFGVDLRCAMAELEMLGVALDPDYVAAVQRSLLAQERQTLARKEPRRLAAEAAAAGAAMPWDPAEFGLPADCWEEEPTTPDDGIPF
jgi:hypothetical protein